MLGHLVNIDRDAALAGRRVVDDRTDDALAVADKLAYYLSLRVIVSNIVRYIEVEAGYRSGKYDDDNKKQRSNETRMLIQESAPYLSSPDFLAAR